MTIFLGTGAMGAALTIAAVRDGGSAVVWNRSPQRAHALTRTPGVSAAEDPRDAVTAGDVIVTCLLDHASVHEVLDPLVADLAGRTVINMTTTTPNQSRELAAWAAAHDIAYLDGAIMAVPEMIGEPGSMIFYSGSPLVFGKHRKLLDRWGSSEFFGPDPGLAALSDMAMLTGMYAMIGGFLHGTAMVGAAGVPATAFARRQGPFLAAMAGQLAGYAATIDAADYTGAGQQSLRFTEAALSTLIESSADEGISTELIDPVRELVRRQIAAGFGDHGTARILEELRSSR
ncbi:NAD(P)-dependent oxidoreductase [Actinoplanes utahensis]|uniref:Dehydrogenase n=1 Tax=Actinoplanes utahensis TaxID=1869 RepID=A0A0A6UHE7_ACTUT|nr:NAD(P)-binding domain-containing protein [Actinoplanes utahensis]KHD74846.1 dehydrogenase [Actinoplanes utahensis]GIF30783.1 oxidoreductase [Actinoplanes utahensis]